MMEEKIEEAKGKLQKSLLQMVQYEAMKIRGENLIEQSGFLFSDDTKDLYLADTNSQLCSLNHKEIFESLYSLNIRDLSLEDMFHIQKLEFEYPNITYLRSIEKLLKYGITYPTCYKGKGSDLQYLTYEEIEANCKKINEQIETITDLKKGDKSINKLERERLLKTVDYLKRMDFITLAYQNKRYDKLFELLKKLGVEGKISRGGGIDFFDLDHRFIGIREPEGIVHSPDILLPGKYVEIIGNNIYYKISTTESTIEKDREQRKPMLRGIEIENGGNLIYSITFSKIADKESRMGFEITNKELELDYKFYITSNQNSVDDIYRFNIDRSEIINILNDDVVKAIVEYYEEYAPELVAAVNRIKEDYSLRLK